MKSALRRVVITGAGSGIGRALAIEASRRGMRVVMCGRREEPLIGTRALLARPEEHLIVACDVLDATQRSHLTSEVDRQWGGVDMLINNAGIIAFGPLSCADPRELENLIATNLTAPICLVRDFLPLLKRGVDPQIANMGSLLGSIPYPLFAAYSASKSGLHGFSVALRRELAPLGISVSHIAPRGTKTTAASAFESYAKPLEMRFDHPEAVALSVFDGLAKRKSTICPRGAEQWFIAAQAIAPGLVDHAIAKQLGRAEAKGLPIH
jgi:short-subunit dehydrogenase